jgi:hypothetical protein
MFLLRITQAFAQANIPYALVGGYAVALHGAVRGTIDVDIIITLDKQHFERTEQLLLDLGLQPKLPIQAADLFEHRKAYIQEKNLIAWSFVNPDKPSECLDIIITEDLRQKQVETKQLQQQSIQVLGKADLIAMKKVSGRPQDLADIQALEALD